MEYLIGIIIGLVIVVALYGMLCALVQRYPVVIGIGGIGGGLIVWFYTTWWIGLIVGLMISGFLIHAGEQEI